MQSPFQILINFYFRNLLQQLLISRPVMTSSVEAACQCCEFEVDGTVRNFSEVSVGMTDNIARKVP